MSRQGPSTPARTASLRGWPHPASSALGHDPARAAHEQAQQTLAKMFARGAGPTLPGALTQSHTPLPRPLCPGIDCKVPLASLRAVPEVNKHVYLYLPVI